MFDNDNINRFQVVTAILVYAVPMEPLVRQVPMENSDLQATRVLHRKPILFPVRLANRAMPVRGARPAMLVFKAKMVTLELLVRRDGPGHQAPLDLLAMLDLPVLPASQDPKVQNSFICLQCVALSHYVFEVTEFFHVTKSILNEFGSRPVEPYRCR